MSNYLITTLLVSFIALATVNAAIPSYIKVCKQNDPDITNCIKNSVLSLREKLASGIPELDVPSLDPLWLAELSLNLGAGFHTVAQNLSITGAKDFQLTKFNADIAEVLYDLDIFIPELKAVGVYEIDAKIAGIPLKGKGPLSLTLRSVTVVAKLYGKKIRRAGKTLVYFPKMTLKAKLEDYEVKLANLFTGDPAIGDATNKLLNEEKTEVLATLLPALEKSITERILAAANNICKHFTWDELFPES